MTGRGGVDRDLRRLLVVLRLRTADVDKRQDIEALRRERPTDALAPVLVLGQDKAEWAAGPFVHPAGHAAFRVLLAVAVPEVRLLTSAEHLVFAFLGPNLRAAPVPMQASASWRGHAIVSVGGNLLPRTK